MPAPPQPERVTLRPEDRDELAAEAERLASQAAAIEDPEVKSWVAELNELVRALQEGRITPEEAHAQIARLQKAQEAWSDKVGEDVAEVARHAKRAAESVKRPHAATAPLLEALRAEHWAAAARAMRELRERTERGELGEKDARAVQKDMQQLAKSLESESQQREERLKQERDRLKKKEEQQKDRFAQRDRDRLKKTERELEQLRRESEGAGEARRQLERLQREMDRAAQDLARRGGQQEPQTAEQMRKAEDIMRRLSEMAEGQRQMRVAQGRLVDLEEMMRRAGKQGQGKDGQGQDGELDEQAEQAPEAAKERGGLALLDEAGPQRGEGDLDAAAPELQDVEQHHRGGEGGEEGEQLGGGHEGEGHLRKPPARKRPRTSSSKGVWTEASK